MPTSRDGKPTRDISAPGCLKSNTSVVKAIPTFLADRTISDLLTDGSSAGLSEHNDVLAGLGELVPEPDNLSALPLPSPPQN